MNQSLVAVEYLDRGMVLLLHVLTSLQPARLREVKYRQQKARFLIAPSVSSCQGREMNV